MKVSNQALGQTVFTTDNLLAKQTNGKDDAAKPLTAKQNQGVFAKKNEGDSVAAAMRQKLFAAQQSQTEQQTEQKTELVARWEINGVTEETDFPKTVGADESQESVLRRTYDEYAFKAGLTKESAAEFVNERMAANKAENNGGYSIFNPKTEAAYSPDEWKAFQQTGGIVMNPTAADIQALTNFKTVDDFRAGEAAADQVSKALELGDRNALVKLFSNADASSELGKALQTVQQRADNSDFQTGFISKLEAEKFVKLEKKLADNPGYRNLMQTALSTVARNEPEFAPGVEHDPTISQQIASKADAETLARLSANDANPMSKDFLVEAGKRVMTKEVGWTTRAGGEMGVAVKYNIYNAGTQKVLQAVAKNLEASLELLQDADFVKNALKLENSGKNEDTISQIIRSGMSKDMQASNGERVNNALRTIIELAKNPNGIKGTSKSGLHESSEAISERTAITLAEVYQNNIESFSEATGRSGNRANSLSVDDARALLKAIQPHSAVKDANGVTLSDKIAAATAIEYTKLLAKAESSGDISYAEKAANVAGAYIDAKNQSSLAEAREAEARREQLGKVLGIVSELTIAHGAKGVASDLVIDALGKTAAAVSEASVKSDDVDDAKVQNRPTLENQQATNKISLVQVHEQAAFERVSGAQTATPDEKAKAEQFLNDMKEYNESLSPSAKILDANGRLINPAKMSDRQKDSMEDIFQGSENQARRRLSDRMRATYNELLNATERQVKN